jgi:hypothetical protein
MVVGESDVIQGMRFVHRIAGVFYFFHRPVILGVETRRFGNWICPQVKRGEDIYLVGLIERANVSSLSKVPN